VFHRKRRSDYSFFAVYVPLIGPIKNGMSLSGDIPFLMPQQETAGHSSAMPANTGRLLRLSGHCLTETATERAKGKRKC